MAENRVPKPVNLPFPSAYCTMRLAAYDRSFFLPLSAGVQWECFQLIIGQIITLFLIDFEGKRFLSDLRRPEIEVSKAKITLFFNTDKPYCVI